MPLVLPLLSMWSPLVLNFHNERLNTGRAGIDSQLVMSRRPAAHGTAGVGSCFVHILKG